jgi:hypothetical protein
MSIKGNTMKTLIVKALIVLSVLFSETAVYAHEEIRPELSPLQRSQIWSLAEARVNCSTIIISAFPENDQIAQFGSEIIIDAIRDFEIANPSGGVTEEQLATYAKAGISMWENSDHRGREDALKVCGQELLKRKIPPQGVYVDPSTPLLM